MSIDSRRPGITEMRSTPLNTPLWLPLMSIGTPKLFRSSHSATVTPERAKCIVVKALWKLSQETFETSDFDGFASKPMSERITIMR